MTVTELITALKDMPPDAEVMHLWEGGLRSTIENVWLAKSGVVGTSDRQEVCYYDDDRPKDAPSVAQQPIWETP